MLIKKIQLTYGQGHEVKGQGQTCSYEKMFFAFETWTEDWILMILLHIIDTNHKISLSKSQGHGVIGQGQIDSCIWKHCFFL